MVVKVFGGSGLAVVTVCGGSELLISSIGTSRFYETLGLIIERHIKKIFYFENAIPIVITYLLDASYNIKIVFFY